MSLPHAILGLLQYMPMTGYDLKMQAFDRTVTHFWSAVLPQIYRELDKLEAEGWATSIIEVQQERPNRRVYSITPSGQAEFARWLHEFQPPPAHREAFLIQLFFAAQLRNEEIIALLEAQLVARREQRARFGQIEGEFDGDHPREEMLAWLTLDLGERMTDLYIRWLEDAIAKVKHLPE
jgi:PadR family transcriptional regulator, regulatory protein AphA